MSKIEKTCTFGEVSLKLYVFPLTWNILPFCSVIAPRLGYYPGKRVTSVLLHARGVDVCPMAQAKPRATKLMLHAFLGSNLLVSFYFAAMASFKVTYLLIA